MSDSLTQQIAELEADLKQPVSDTARKRLEAELSRLRAELAKQRASVIGEVNLSDSAKIDGVAVGVNYSSITYGHGAQPPAPSSSGTPLTSATDEQVADQRKRLEIARATLAHYLHQQAIAGSANVRPEVMHGMREARKEIKHIKTTLRGWGQSVFDHPDDEAG